MEQFSEQEYIKAHQELAETDELNINLTDTIRESIKEEIKLWKSRLANWKDLKGLDNEENQYRRELAEYDLYLLEKKLTKLKKNTESI